MLTGSNVRLSNLLISSCYYYYLQEIRSVELGVCPMQLFIFDHVTFIQFKICCCVQQFHENPMIFAEIWRYNDFQNGGCPPSGNCFATIRETTHEVSVAGRSCLSNFMSIWYTDLKNDIAIWIFRIFGLKCLFGPPKWGFSGDFGPLNVIIHHRDPKRHIFV